MIPVGTKVWVMGRLAGLVSGYGTVLVGGTLEQVYIVLLEGTLSPPDAAIYITDIAVGWQEITRRDR